MAAFITKYMFLIKETMSTYEHFKELMKPKPPTLRSVGSIVMLAKRFRKTLVHKIYAPGGPGYLAARNDFEAR